MHPFLRGLFFLLFASVSAWGQFDAASVLGTVNDANRAVIVDANITLTNIETGIKAQTKTNENGDFLFPVVKIGNYRLETEKSGFTKATVNDINVTVNARRRVDVVMQVGQVTEIVNVAESTPLLETDSSSKGQVIQQKQIVGLPLLGRSYANLALLVPGVRQSQVGNQGSIAFRREGSYNVNGLRSVYNNFLLDGVDNNFYGTTNQGFSNQASQPSPDSVAEFRMSINAYSAEFGRTGGAVMNVSSKSGTNSLRGTLWNFLQNTNMNAYGFFRPRRADGQLFPKPTVRRNQFGFVLGGAIIKNKTFFFADYEGSRWTQNPFGQVTLPTTAQRQGILPAAVTVPYTFTASNGQAIAAGTVIPAGQPIPMTAFARRVLNELPATNLSPTIYGGPDVNRLNDDKGAIKIDHQAKDDLSLFARYTHRRQNIFAPGVVSGFSGGNNLGNLDVFNQQGIFGATWTKSASEILEYRFAVTRLGMDRLPAQVGGPSMRELFGITGLPEGPRIQGGITPQDIQGFSRIGRQSTNPQAQFPTTTNSRLNLTKLLGRHTLKTGYELLHLAILVDDTNPLYGIDSYNGSVSGQALSDFFFGARASYQIATQVQARVRQQAHWWYVQDDWKVNSKLTLNLGLRYEITSPVYDADNRLSNFDPASNSIITAQSGSIEKRTLRQQRWNNFAPRLGLAYQLGAKTVIRTGYGLGWNYWNRMASAELLNTNAPFVTRFSTTQSGPLARAGTLCTANNYVNCFRPTQNGYPTNLPSNVILHIQRDLPWSNVQNWHFTMQHQITPKTMVDIAYVGNRGSNLPLLGDLNQARPITTAELAQGLTSTATLQARRPIAGFGNITAVVDTGFSNYHGLQLKMEHRGNSFTVLNSFTYSKAIDNVGQVLETTNGGSPNPQDIRNPKNDKGPSSFDQRFNNTTSLVYQIPFGKGQRFGSQWNPVINGFLGGWELGSTITLTSGQPLNVRYGDSQFFASDNQADFLGGVALRPNLIGGPLKFNSSDRVLPNGTVQLINRSAFALPTADQPFGSAGRNLLYGFPFYQTDLALQKSFRLPLNEVSRLTFRAEAFNLLNQVNFNAPIVDLRNANFGRVTSTFDPRIMQLALKLYF
jgi:hypothetical protein